ncbi:unnamed protein product [Rotaria socialis]|uniref:Uncharacterized protein n=1 Tax=Rotaria socialis TaxID=392032 RepID=A0A818Q8W3_9BILA|nr:unnamed protein product [Rotaria socialis]CAF3633297.1 unnamed protein product [Rotaria socialis]CAF3699431.1 unnamed protein product [Rotaria socialis]CAF4289505.1 unnamed protein product [Rotaria socialis]CAF4478034.1 unnamed protein product [Rotaria socialis]
MIKINIILIAFLVYIQTVSVLTLTVELGDLEENILHSYLKDPNNLKLFYNKLIQSNGVDDLIYIRQNITDEDIQQGTVENKCFQSTDSLLDAFNISLKDKNQILTRADVKQLIPTLVDVKHNDGCLKQHGATKWKNVLVGLISVTIINMAALFSAIILPFRKRPTFKWLLTTFIGLAVGTLLGTGIFHLIPMAFSIEKFDKDSTFLTKALVTIIAIYLFYIRDLLCDTFLRIETVVSTHSHGDEDISPILQQKNTKSLLANLKTMKPIGWMILISDLLHGFIDGITIGAISIVSISECLRMMVPIVCEEFSHKLGDAAILLSSGLPIKQALLMNFLSSCGCYPGFILGAKLGELENFHPWICGLAGGMFVYIGLTDMIPELISIGHEIEKDYTTANKPITRKLRLEILLSQNIGVVLGIAIMFLLAKYGEILSQYF